MPNLNTRIKNIQKYLKIDATGILDLATCKSILALGNKVLDSKALKENIIEVQRLIGLKGGDVDGIVGVITITKLENFLSPVLPSIPSGASLIVSIKSLDFIEKEEIISKSYYEKKLIKPYWPKGESGITIGIGYDLGYNTAKDIQSDWQDYITTQKLEKLKAVSGLKGENASLQLSSVSKITIDYVSAANVFYQISLPKFAKKVVAIYPEAARLPPDAQGALLSLVYNRGNGLKGESRKEMANIVSHVSKSDLPAIASEIRSMKRIWENKNQPGLIKRREAEAVLVEEATHFIKPEDYIII
jgi:Bacterial toxin homologue of phage lysozyme, C-term